MLGALKMEFGKFCQPHVQYYILDQRVGVYGFKIIVIINMLFTSLVPFHFISVIARLFEAFSAHAAQRHTILLSSAGQILTLQSIFFIFPLTSLLRRTSIKISAPGLVTFPLSGSLSLSVFQVALSNMNARRCLCSSPL